MRILYHIPFLETPGAEHWIYMGWRDAFCDLGHEFFEFTAEHNLQSRLREVRPDIFITAINLLDPLKDPVVLQKARKLGVKVFLSVFWPLGKQHEEWKKILEKENIADIYFGEREPESMREFENMDKSYHCIPNAANKLLHFPGESVLKYQYDIVYLGARLPKKEWFFKRVLLPLKNKYRVGIFGPYWTKRDLILAAAHKLCRMARSSLVASFLNRFRVTISPEDERLLYASSKICVNFHERESDGSQPHYILNQRTFKIPACGGFEICDFVPALRKYFAEDEVIMAQDEKDWIKKIEYYLTHKEERRRIQEKGTQRALLEHTYHNRVKQVIDLYQSIE